MHLTGGIGDRVAPRQVRRIGSTGLVALLAAALAGGTLGGSPSTAATTPGAPPMPAALKPGTVTAPVFPMRTVPGFAGPTHADARVRDGDGGTDQRFNVPTPAGSTLLWGDWNRDGAVTPIVFTSGHWVVYDAIVGPTPTPSREFDYGMPGDKPVVGDFNRDGRTDVGVVRGNVWLLRSFPSAGATWRRFGFGAATDVPLTGDWNGDGRDGVGVRRGPTYYLLESPKGQRAQGAADLHLRLRPSLGRRRDRRLERRRLRHRGCRPWGSLVPPRPPVEDPGRRDEPQGPQAGGAVDRHHPPGQRAVRGGARAVEHPGRSHRRRLRHRLGGGRQPRPGLRAGQAQPAARQGPPLRPGQPGAGTDPVFQLRATLLESERYLLGAQYIERWYNRRGQRYTDVLSRSASPTRSTRCAGRRWPR